MKRSDIVVVGILGLTLMLTAIPEAWASYAIVGLVVAIVFLPPRFDPAIQSKDKSESTSNGGQKT